MSELKAQLDTEAGGRQSLSVPPLSTAPYVSDEDLAKLVVLTPLTKTLQDIQQSLQKLSHKSRAQDDTGMTMKFIYRLIFRLLTLKDILYLNCLVKKSNEWNEKYFLNEH